ncbi:MAG: HyaD/HybD family hydrogenase maturation endopeptidase [Actinobacteria bacterium]|nr:HyaD/HybD family hydrogenase maturation endopeptidase [Actinomycetota bacterium]
MRGRSVVLGVGNVLNRDEGLGVHALRLLEGRLPDGGPVEAIDGGVLGLNLLPLVEECERLLVLDAVDRGAPPGTLVEMDRDEIPLFAGVKMSQHQITMQEVLGLAQVRGKLPPVLRLVGLQPEDLSIGIEMSVAIEAALPQVVDRAAEVVAAWQEEDARV